MRLLEDGVSLSHILYEISKEVYPVNLRMLLYVSVKAKTEITFFFSLEGALALKTLETQVQEIFIILALTWIF